jgi:hypothetical protein
MDPTLLELQKHLAVIGLLQLNGWRPTHRRSKELVLINLLFFPLKEKTKKKKTKSKEKKTKSKVRPRVYAKGTVVIID